MAFTKFLLNIGYRVQLYNCELHPLKHGYATLYALDCCESAPQRIIESAFQNHSGKRNLGDLPAHVKLRIVLSLAAKILVGTSYAYKFICDECHLKTVCFIKFATHINTQNIKTF